MQLFIDSADPKQIKEAWGWGFMDGVTTNPSLAAKTGKGYSQIIEEILEIIDPEATLSLEVIGTSFDEMVEQGRALSKLDERIVVKVPCTTEGIKATKQLTSEGILVNVTLVFTLSQALLAAKAGAFYVSPFVGRLEDEEPGSGLELVSEIVATYDEYEYNTQVLYASVRDQESVEAAMLLGADIATCPFEVLKTLVGHPMTDKGLTKFLEDWKDSGLKLPLPA